jgi:hypothetical protein
MMNGSQRHVCCGFININGMVCSLQAQFRVARTKMTRSLMSRTNPAAGLADALPAIPE